MDKNKTLLAALIIASGVISVSTYAQVDDHAAHEEAEGRVVWENLESGTAACADLSDEDFAVLGEYFMGQMLGDAHEAMNTHMVQMMGEEGEELMHIVLGKRWSGCDETAPFPQSGGWGFMPMMNMMGGGMMAPLREGFGGQGGWSAPLGTSLNHMMYGSGYTPFSGISFLLMVVWWIFIIAGIVALVRWARKGGHTTRESLSPLDILKERYAKGEITRQQFQEMSKDIGNA